MRVSSLSTSELIGKRRTWMEEFECQRWIPSQNEKTRWVDAVLEMIDYPGCAASCISAQLLLFILLDSPFLTPVKTQFISITSSSRVIHTIFRLQTSPGSPQTWKNRCSTICFSRENLERIVSFSMRNRLPNSRSWINKFFLHACPCQGKTADKPWELWAFRTIPSSELG